MLEKLVMVLPVSVLLIVMTVGIAAGQADTQPPQPCEGRWVLKVTVTKEKAFCRKGRSFQTSFDVLRGGGGWVSRSRPSLERNYKVQAMLKGSSCQLRWHDELVTTVASPYDLLVTDYELEATGGIVAGVGHRSEATVGMEASCSEELEVTGSWRPLAKQDFGLNMRRVKKDLGKLLELMPEFCSKEDLPNLQGPISVELTVAKRGGVFELVVNDGKPFQMMESCARILSENLLDLFPNPTGIEQKVKLDVDGTASSKKSKKKSK
jgi:hypothetical protein